KQQKDFEAIRNLAPCIKTQPAYLQELQSLHRSLSKKQKIAITKALSFHRDDGLILQLLENDKEPHH
ncbi:MAG: hypothetical protein NTV44_05840, partial [Firmicutes bacterium]|nr:hypothetical protein [Bacillota bacterium]